MNHKKKKIKYRIKKLITLGILLVVKSINDK